MVIILTSETLALLPPSFVSEWVLMNAADEDSTYVVFNHSLNDVPVRVEVQVRASTNDTFPGLSSAYNGGSVPGRRGGVICRYNDQSIELYGATGSDRAYIAFSGMEAYTNDTIVNETSAYVRVRAWHASDMPVADVISKEFLMQPGGAKAHNDYKHPLKAIPALAVVQLRDEDGWYTEAQGTDCHDDNPSVPLKIYWGGLVYGVKPDTVRLWAPTEDKNEQVGTFSFCDGWGYNTTNVTECLRKDLYVTVMLWKDLLSEKLHHSELYVDTSINVTSYLAAINNTFSLERDLFLVSVIDKKGEYHYYGIGAAQYDGPLNHASGVISAFNEYNQSVRLWTPLASRFAVRLTNTNLGMGDKKNPVSETQARVYIDIWKGENPCPNILATDLPENATILENSTSRVAIECMANTMLKSGSLILGCNKTSGQWNDSLPVCGSTCADITSVMPSVEVLTNVTNLMMFTCKGASKLLSGSLTLTCFDGSWSDSAPNCGVCPTIESGINAILDVEYLFSSLIANYTCKDGYSIISGNLTRYCDVIGGNPVWSGSPPVCQHACRILETGEGAVLDVASLTTGLVSRSSCLPSYNHLGGNHNRHCNVNNGTWTGNPPLCQDTNSTEVYLACSTCVQATRTIVCINITVISAPEVLAAAEQVAEEIVKNLTVEAKTTSKFIRSLTSAQDGRASVQMVGLTGTLIIAVVFGLIFISDIMSFFLRKRSTAEQPIEQLDT